MHPLHAICTHSMRYAPTPCDMHPLHAICTHSMRYAPTPCDTDPLHAIWDTHPLHGICTHSMPYAPTPCHMHPLHAICTHSIIAIIYNYARSPSLPPTCTSSCMHFCVFVSGMRVYVHKEKYKGVWKAFINGLPTLVEGLYKWTANARGRPL